MCVCVCVCIYIYISQINNIHLKATMICKVALTRHFWQSTGVWHMADTNTSKTRQTPVPSSVFFLFLFFSLSSLTRRGHGSRGFSWFRGVFFFWVLTGSAIDEASTSYIEIAPLFALTLLFNLTRLLSLCFCRLLFLHFSFSAFFSFVVSTIFFSPLNSRVF